MSLMLWAIAVGAQAAPRAKSVTFTVVSANLSDNTTQAYEEPGIRILQALQPDVVGIQEFNYRWGNTDDLVRRLFGPGYYFCRETGGVRLPNGVISRFPILAHGQWEDPYVANRRLFWATVDLPGPKDLHVVSVHLVQNRANRRLAETDFLVEKIRKQFPAKDYVVLCGDLNITSRGAGVMAVLERIFVDDRHPVDQLDNPNTNAKRSHPYDVVLPNRALAPFQVPTVVAGKRFANGLVFDTRLWDYPPPPADWEDSANNMQHMPVMKTFRVPLE